MISALLIFHWIDWVRSLTTDAPFEWAPHHFRSSYIDRRPCKPESDDFIGGNLAPSLGGREKISQTKISEWRFFRKEISIFTSKISDDLFKVMFSRFFLSFSISLLCEMSYMTLSSPLFQKRIPWWHLFYSVRTFERIRQHYFPKYWGTNAWAVPTSNVGSVPPVPLGLRPWMSLK